jgi:putative glycosyltransferase (TIGR04372 family)
MKAVLTRVKNVANDRITRVLFYDQTLKKGYASLASFSKLFVLRRILVTLVAYPLSLVCWVLLVVLNRFTPVRMYRFKRPQRPGFASVYIEQLEPLCRELQNSGNKGFLIFVDASQTTNLELLKLYATHFNLYLDDRVAFARTVFAVMPKFGLNNTYAKHSPYDTNWELAPAIKLGTKEKPEVPNIISQLELEPFKFVILTHRSFLYDAKYHQNASLELNRSTDISKAEDAIRLIYESGLKVVRIGIDTDEIPDSLKHLPIIDLSGNFRTDAQDLWLSANCLFLWGIDNNGAWHFAHKYNRPTLVTNSYAFPKGHKQTFFTFQLIWDKNLNRLLTLREMVSLKGVVGRTTPMHERGLTFVQNSSDQLRAVVIEVLDVLGSEPTHKKYDNKLLINYDIISSTVGAPPRVNFHTRPCISFLDSISEIIE